MAVEWLGPSPARCRNSRSSAANELAHQGDVADVDADFERGVATNLSLPCFSRCSASPAAPLQAAVCAATRPRPATRTAGVRPLLMRRVLTKIAWVAVLLEPAPPGGDSTCFPHLAYITLRAASPESSPRDRGRGDCRKSTMGALLVRADHILLHLFCGILRADSPMRCRRWR